jgi:hypothetical protein
MADILRRILVLSVRPIQKEFCKENSRTPPREAKNQNPAFFFDSFLQSVVSFERWSKVCHVNAIEEHSRGILRSDSTPYQEVCKACRSSRLVRHDVRRREFYFRDELGCARSISSWIARWKCSQCKGIFTDYPPFALPEKRYTKDTIIEVTLSFCEVDQATYRSPLLSLRAPKEEPQIHGSTLWRWISWMKSRWWIAPRIIDLFLQWYPNSMIHRQRWPVAPCKARSEERLGDVSDARKFIRLIQMFEAEKWYRTSPTLQHCFSPLDSYTAKPLAVQHSSPG